MTERLLLSPPALDTQKNSLLLDFDGTLVDLGERPDTVVVDERLSTLLAQLSNRFGGRLALVSGRSVDQLIGLFGQPSAGMALIGSHGAEIVTSTRRSAPIPPLSLTEVQRELENAFGKREGIVIEVKSYGIALHYRTVPDEEPAVRALASRLIRDVDLELQEGKMMIEVRVPGVDKGKGIAALMGEPPFAGTIPVFAGDDVTDEAGFVAVARLSGIGVLVGPKRPTAATCRLDDVAAVHTWLEQAL